MKSESTHLYSHGLDEDQEAQREARPYPVESGLPQDPIESAAESVRWNSAQFIEDLSDDSDEALLNLSTDENKDALGILFRRYASVVRAIAYRILRDASEAEDVLQEVFLYIFRKWTLFDSKRGSARSWIIQVAYHRAIDRRRHLASRHFYSNCGLEAEERATDCVFYERSIEGVLGKALVERIEKSLSEDQHRTMQLYFFEGHSLEEIAEHLGQPLGNIRNHYYRGLEKMRQLIFADKLRTK